MGYRKSILGLASTVVMLLLFVIVGCSAPSSPSPTWSEEDVYVFRRVGMLGSEDRRYAVHGTQVLILRREGAKPSLRIAHVPQSLLGELTKWAVEVGAKDLSIHHTGKPFVSRTVFHLGKYEDRQTRYWLTTEMIGFLKKLDELEIDSEVTKESLAWMDDADVKRELGIPEK